MSKSNTTDSSINPLRGVMRRAHALGLLGALIVLSLSTIDPALASSAPSAPPSNVPGVPFGPRPFDTKPLLPEHAVHRVSAHVYILEGFPNIGIIVGNRGTLVVDTGLGKRNGALVAQAARALSTRGQQLYLTTTHYHPEHASGWGGFPKATLLIRNRVQQAEADSDGARMIELFRTSLPPHDLMHQLLQGATDGVADIVFEKEADLDLGGVHARLLYFGAAHTRGDELTFVPEDGVLLPGDVVQNQLVPNFTCAECNPRSWIAVLDQVASLHPSIILPDHGGFGGEALISQERSFLVDLQSSANQLKHQGKSVTDASREIASQFATRYAGWQGLNSLPQAVRRAYAGSQQPPP